MTTLVDSLRERRYSTQHHRSWWSDIDGAVVAILGVFLGFIGFIIVMCVILNNQSNNYNKHFRQQCDRMHGYTLIGDRDICLSSKNAILKREPAN
jgi:hypothetical protein